MLVSEPLTSVFMVLEVSGNYSIILPVIVANTFAYVISRAFHQTAIFDTLTRQDGLELPSMEEQREESVLRVEDAMLPPAKRVLDADDLLAWTACLLDSNAPDAFLVRLHPAGWSSVTRTEIESLIDEDREGRLLASILAERHIPLLHPDQPLDMALRYADRWPLVPVVSRADFGKLEGVITQNNVLEKYRHFDEE